MGGGGGAAAVMEASSRILDEAHPDNADPGRMKAAEEIYQRALAGDQEAEGDQEADIRYLQEQLSALEVDHWPRDARADRCVGGIQTPTAHFVPGTVNQREASQSTPRGRKRDFVLRMFRKQ